MSYQFNNGINIPITSNEAITSIQNNYDPNQTVVRLFVFDPEQVTDTYKRPQAYNFAGDFINDVSDCAERSRNGVEFDAYRDSYMTKYSSAANAIIPANEGHFLETSRFGDFPRFVLQIDNANPYTGNIYTGPRLTNRRIYSGIILSEPYTENMGRIVENPNAVLKILHMSALNNQTTASAHGSTQKMRLTSDLDFLPPDLCLQLDNSLTELLRPKDIAEATAESTTGEFFVSDHNSIAKNGLKPIPINTAYNSPMQHMHDVVFGILSGIDNVSSNVGTSGILGSNMSSLGTSTDHLEASINASLNIAEPTDPIGIDGTMLYTISDLRRKFPGMQLIPAKSDAGSFNDLANQAVLTRSNKGCDIIITSVPVVAMNVGLSEIAFRYSSCDPTDSFTIGGPKDVFHVDNVATWSHENGTSIEFRVKSFLNHFRMQVVPPLYALGGDFELMCSFTSSGTCDAMLIYYDDPTSNMGIYQSPLFLGGINSPVIGNGGIKYNNGSHLKTLKAGVIANLTTPFNGNEFGMDQGSQPSSFASRLFNGF